MTENFNRTSENYSVRCPVIAWRCRVAPKHYWHCEEGQQPNAFHRMMQRLAFGFKWERIDDD